MTSPATGALAALAAQNCSAGAPLLDAADLAPRLAMLAGWIHTDSKLRKTFRFPDYYRTIAFVNAVAWMANRRTTTPTCRSTMATSSSTGRRTTPVE